MTGTSLETIESQTQQDLLFNNLDKYAETRRSQAAPAGEQARAMLEVVAVAAMAQAATLSILTLQDEDTTDATHGAKVHRTDSGGLEVAKKSCDGISK